MRKVGSVIDIQQTMRYSVVSAACLLAGLILIPFLNWQGLHYALATFCAFCLIAILGFLAHSYWTFGVERTLSSFVRYVSAIALNLPLTIVLIGIGHDLLGTSVTVSTVAASAALFLWNYLTARWAILQRRPGAPK